MHQSECINRNIKNTRHFIQQLIKEIEHIRDLKQKCEEEIMRLKASLLNLRKGMQKYGESICKLNNESKYVHRYNDGRAQMPFLEDNGYILTELVFLESSNAYTAKLSYNNTCSATFILHNDTHLCELMEVTPEISNFEIVKEFLYKTQDIAGFLNILGEHFDNMLKK